MQFGMSFRQDDSSGSTDEEPPSWREGEGRWVMIRQVISLQMALSSDTAKQIVKFLKDKKLKKVQASIQQEQVRVVSPSRDELQNVMSILKAEDFDCELKFTNFRSQ